MMAISQLPLHVTSRNIIYEQPAISKQYIDNVNHELKVDWKPLELFWNMMAINWMGGKKGGNLVCMFNLNKI